VVSFTPRPLYPQGKSPFHPVGRKLGGPQSRSGRGGGEEKNSQPLPGLEPPIIQAVVKQSRLISILGIPKRVFPPKQQFSCAQNSFFKICTKRSGNAVSVLKHHAMKTYGVMEIKLH